MSINNLNTYLNVRDAHLRVVSGNVYAQAMNIGGINVETAHGLQSVSDTGNVTSNTLQFSNATTGFVTTANVQIGRDLVVTGNATVSTDLTVSANATVTDTLTVSEHLLASKEATVTGNLHVTTIRSDSNVVAEYTGPHDRPLRKYPEVALTQNDESATSGYVASASSPASISSFQAWKTFSAFTSNQNRWQTSPDTYDSSGNWVSGVGATGVQFTDTNGGEHSGEWIKLQLPKSIKLDYIRYLCNYTDFMTKDFVILGSNDDTSWTLLKSVTGGTSIEDVYHTLHINADGYYKYYVWLTTAINGTGGEVLFNDICFYGHEEGSGSLDTTLKSVYNVPATTGTQLEVYYDGQDYSDVPSSVTDKTGNGHNGTIVGNGVGFDSTYKAFTFAGSDDYFHSTLDWSGDQVHSASFWVKTTRNDVQQTPVLLGTAANSGWANQFSAFELMAGGNIKWYFGNNDIQYYADWTPNTWIHLAFSYIGGGSNSQFKSAYMNGRKLDVKSEPTTSTAVSFNSGDTVIRVGGGYFDTIEDDFTGSVANLRIYEKALNAEQVQELYDYQKDYFLGSKSQVTLYKGHLGVGVTEPSGQLELAGDERIQEYPPRAMTGYSTYIEGHGVFEVENSSVANSSYRSFDAFDKDEDPLVTTAGWVSGLNTYDTGGTGLASGGSATDYFSIYGPGSWLKLKLPYAIKLKSSKFSIRAPNNTLEPLKSFTIYGSKDNTNWDALYSQSTSTPQSFSIDINSTKYYKCFVIHITEVDHNSGYAGIVEWRLFGTPGPTTLDKGSLTLGRSLDVPRVSRYDVDTETPRPEKLLVDYDTTVNSSPTDISGRGSHGSFAGDASYSVADKAFKFTGVSTSDRIVGSMPTSSGDNTLSVSFWYKRTSTSGTQCPFIIGDPSQGQSIAVDIYSTGTVYWFIYSGKYFLWNGVTDTWFPLNTWTHVVCVHTAGTDFANLNEVYINGVPQSSTATFGGNAVDLSLDAGSDALVLGCRSLGTNHAIGHISNFKVYSVALEPSEVKKLYNLGRTGRSMVISDTAVGIGKAPEAQLDVRGNLNVDGVITNQHRPAFYVWRDGTGNNVEAIGHGGQDRLAVTGVITNWDSKRIDTAGTFDLSNGRYYIPVSGLYMLIGAGVYRYQSGNGILEASFYVNGSLIGPRGISYNRGNTTSEHHTVTITFMRFMNAGDYVQMGVPVAQSACDLYYGDNLGYFSGYLLG